MTPSGVRALLRNRVYLGELRVGEHVNSSAHPPLVTDEEWLAAQRFATARPVRSRRPVALLAGLVRCASCGHVMSRSSAGRQNLSYACHRHHSAGSCIRPAAITVGVLDDHVEEICLAELRKLSATPAGANRDVTAARRALREAERELAAYLEGVAAAGLEPGQYAEGARKRSAAVDAERERVDELVARRPGLVEGDPVKAWRQMSADQRNRLLRGLIECVVVAPAGRGKRVPLVDRVRVVKHGARLVAPYGGGGVPLAIRELGLPHPNDPVVLRM